jgi:hypothetical protein
MMKKPGRRSTSRRTSLTRSEVSEFDSSRALFARVLRSSHLHSRATGGIERDVRIGHPQLALLPIGGRRALALSAGLHPRFRRNRTHTLMQAGGLVVSKEPMVWRALTVLVAKTASMPTYSTASSFRLGRVLGRCRRPRGRIMIAAQTHWTTVVLAGHGAGNSVNRHFLFLLRTGLKGPASAYQIRPANASRTWPGAPGCAHLPIPR